MKGRVGFAVLVMGFSGLLAEILLVRELLVVFSGNEFSIGVIFANWLILEAIGCFWPGRMVETTRHKAEAFVLITILFSLSVPAAVLLTRLLRGALGVSVGQSVGLLPIFYSSFLIFLPVSVLHGALFTFSCRLYAIYAGQEATSVGRVYVYETIGTIIAGVACTFLLIHVNVLEAAWGLALLNFAAGVLLLAPERKTGWLPPWPGRQGRQVALAVLGLLVFLFGSLALGGQVDRLQRASIRAQWQGLNVVHYQNSQYGNICVVENQGQYIFFLDGIPSIITPVPDLVAVEEFVHLPLLAHPEPASILILSGGAGGVIREVLKHPSVKAIEYAELDPLLLSLLRKFSTPLTEAELTDARVNLAQVDGRLWLKRTPNRYDLIFVGITEPSDLQTNRFFTREFFLLAQARLNPGGILVLGAPGSLSFANRELRDLNGCVYHTLAGVFPYVRAIPGDGTTLFLASDAPDVASLDAGRAATRWAARNIAAGAALPWHLERKLHPRWQDWFVRFIEGSSRRINYDFQPLGLFYNISYWNALFAPALGPIFRQFERVNLETIAVLLGGMLLLYFLLPARRRSYPSGIPPAIAATGFAGMIVDLVVVLAFQVIYGYVFSWIGLLVAAFMAGTACGAMVMTTALGRLCHVRALFLWIELAIACFCCALPLALLALAARAGSQDAFPALAALFLVLSCIGGGLVGAQFPLANHLYLKERGGLSETAGLLYAADLLGGWLGGLIAAVVLLPVLGLGGSCVAAGLLKLVSFCIMAVQTRSAPVGR